MIHIVITYFLKPLLCVHSITNFRYKKEGLGNAVSTDGSCTVARRPRRRGAVQHICLLANGLRTRTGDRC